MTPVPPVRWRRRALVLLTLLAAIAALLTMSMQRVKLGAQAYLFGYPLVVMDVTHSSARQTLGPDNQLLRVRRFPDASFRDVVRPNVDTLYTTAFIDTSAGPWVFTLPPNSPRYEVMPFMDAWTHVFAAPGARTTGVQGGHFLLVGPQWQGGTPQGMTLLRAPTQLVWLIGRTQTNGAADYPLVHGLQDGISLQPLNGAAAQQVQQKANGEYLPPAQQMQQMDTPRFFERLAALMQVNPPKQQDSPMLEQLAALGVAPGQPVHWNFWQRWCMDLGRHLADRKVANELRQPRNLVRGWSTPPANLGDYGTDYTTRAAVAMVGLGANLPVDALYPSARVDATGQALNGQYRYRLHFPADALPPARAFWSVTAYGADEFLIANPINRYALGDRDKLSRNPDGSLDLWVQAQPPASDAQRANWLPVRAGDAFVLVARLYWPKPEAISGAWGMPGVERLD
jgi:hypothetical protein